MAEPRWFRRFGDAPGVRYTAPGGARRLRGADAIPRLVHYSPDADPVLSWESAQGESSASPVQERSYDVEFGELTTTQVIRHLASTLELPGEPIDYHFALQRVLTALWSRRRTEPSVLDEVERLGWLDVDLVQGCPDLVRVGYGQEGFIRILAFEHLVTLYEREGALIEAHRVAQIASSFDQMADRLEQIAERIEFLHADVPS